MLISGETSDDHRLFLITALWNVIENCNPAVIMFTSQTYLKNGDFSEVVSYFFEKPVNHF